MTISEPQRETLRKVLAAGGAIPDNPKGAKARGIDLRSLPPLLNKGLLYRLNGQLFITTDGDREARG